jgi:hypothetical protein
MKKIYLHVILTIFSLTTFISHAQSCWSPLGSGARGGITEMATYNGQLLAGGYFDTIGGVAAQNVAAWNGATWSALGSGLKIDTAQSDNFYMGSMAVYNGELYVAGQFDTAGGQPVHNVAKWDGASWSAVGSGFSGHYYTVHALAVYKGSLYAGGYFDSAGGNLVNYIAKWDGNQWSAVDSGINRYGGIFCLTVNNGLLYVGGEFYSAGRESAHNIAVWNDTTWAAIGNIGNTEVSSLCFHQGNLYAATFSNTSHDSLRIWDGTNWSTFAGVNNRPFDIAVSALLSFDGKLLVGGGFDTLAGIPAHNLAQWDGSTWSEFGGGLSGSNSPWVDALFTLSGHLYASGAFTRADTTSANSIAEYTCATTDISDIYANKLQVYPNPTAGIITVSAENIQAGSQLQIYDMLGEKIFQTELVNNKTEIDLRGRAAGLYIYQIPMNDGSTRSGKISLQ